VVPGGRIRLASSALSVLVETEQGCYRYVEMVDGTPGCWLRWREALRILEAAADEREEGARTLKACQGKAGLQLNAGGYQVDT
jgi:hypothetical protein